jgi:hypothetical protein
MAATHVTCTSAAFSFIAAEVKKTEEQFIESCGNVRLFASFCHLLDCKPVIFTDIILRQLVILLGMGYNFRRFFGLWIFQSGWFTNLLL